MPPYRDPSPPSPGAGLAREIIYRAAAAPPSFSSVLATWRQSLIAAVRGKPLARTADPRNVALRVEDRELRVSFGEQLVLSASLRDLLDVELDSRSIEKFQRQVGPDGVIGSGRTFALDVSRIVLVVAGRAHGFPLSEAYDSYSESLVWMGRVRQFLRAHGWVPDDERQA